MALKSFLGAIGRGLSNPRRMIGMDELYLDGRTPPFLPDTVQMPGLDVPEGEDPYPAAADMQEVPVPSRSKADKPKSEGKGRRIAGGTGSLIMSGIDAAATPNVALGGPTDFFRALQNSQGGREDRDAAAINRQIALENLASNRANRQAQIEENLAQAQYWKKRAELEGQPKPKPRKTGFNPKTGALMDLETGETLGAAPKPDAPPPMVNVGVGQQGEPLGYAPPLSMDVETPMGGTKTLDFPAYGQMVPMKPNEAAQMYNAATAHKKATAPPVPKEDMTVTMADALARSKDPRLPPEERQRWKDTYDQLKKDAVSLRMMNPAMQPSAKVEYVFRKRPDGKFNKHITYTDRGGNVVNTRIEEDVVPPAQPQDLLGLGGDTPAPALQEEKGGFWDGITDLFGGDEEKRPAAQPQQGGPKPDEVRYKGGVPYKFNGKEWVAQQ